MRWRAAGALGVLLVAACTGLKVDPLGRPCNDKEPCGAGTVCDPRTRTCVKGGVVDGPSPDLPLDMRASDAPLADRGDGPRLDAGVFEARPVDAPPNPDLPPKPDLRAIDKFLVPDGGCPSGMVSCSGECANLSDSVKHCGTCGNACLAAAADRCVAGKCVCGTTGALCPSTLNCVAGACACIAGGRCSGCCEAGACVPPGATQSSSKCGQNGEACKSCTDNNYCTSDSCSATGACVSTPKTDGLACNDGNACSHTDVCKVGVCTGTTFSCSDGLACTSGECLGTPPPNNCTQHLDPGTCLIGNKCYDDIDVNPAAPCTQQCQSATSSLTWTAISGPCVSTVAGNGAYAFADGPAATAAFDVPHGVAVDSSGNIYVADHDNHRVRMISGGVVSTIAGTGTAGLINGAASVSRLNEPHAVAVDGTGAVYVADSLNHVIRKIAGGQVTTFAGSGTQGFADGAVATARFNMPAGLVLDSSGALYVSDRYNHRVRKIESGQVTTVAGSGTAGFQDGAAAQARFNFPREVAIDSSGALYLADSTNHRIRKIAGGQVTTLAGTGVAGYLNGSAASARLDTPLGVAVNAAGSVYFTDYNDRVRVISAGTVTVLAGDGTVGFRDGPVATARFSDPYGIALVGSSELYVADSDNNRIRLIKF